MAAVAAPALAKPPSPAFVSALTAGGVGPVSSLTTVSPAPPAAAAPGAKTFNLTQDVEGPKSNALAAALIRQGYDMPKRSLLEALGGLAQVAAGTKAQSEFETAEKERGLLPAKQLQEFAAQGGDFGDADAMISTGVPALVEAGFKQKQAEAEAALKPIEYDTVEGDDGTIYRVPKTGASVTPQIIHKGIPPGFREPTAAEIATTPELANGYIIETKTGLPKKLEVDTPLTDVGKIQQAYVRGEFGTPGTPMADELYAASMQAEQMKLSGYKPMTPEQRLLYGISPSDKSVWMMSPEGKPENIATPEHFTDLPPDKDGNVWQRNDVTNELKMIKAGTKAPTLPAGYRWKDEAAGIAEPIPGVPPKSELTETQSKMLFYYGRGMRANEDLKSIDTALTSLPDAFWYGVHRPTGNLMVDQQYQLAKAAANEFLIMLLRPDTGAAVTDQEFEIYGPTYLPMPGDTPETIAKKREMRAWAMHALKGTLGNAKPLADQFDEDLLGRPNPLMSPVNPASPSGTIGIPEVLPAPGPDGNIHLPDGTVLVPSGG